MERLESEDLLSQARLLAKRLERLSADSLWARRASGYRASLLKMIDEIEKANQQERTITENQLHRLRGLVTGGYLILERGVKEYYRTYRKIR